MGIFALPARKDMFLSSMTSGMEFELFTLDSHGNMINAADQLIKAVKTVAPHINITRECGKNMVEINTAPENNIPLLMEKVLDDFETVLHCAEREGIVLYSYGTYPGSFMPETHEDRRYLIQEQIFGKKRFAIAQRCVGMHLHFSLPWGVFDNATRMIVPDLISSKNLKSMMHMYNLFIAMDPALSTFSQSSPFYQGSRLGKDARIITYRGGDTLHYPQGLYAKHQEFGALQPYRVSSNDLIDFIVSKFEGWKSLIKSFDVNIRTFLKRGSVLDTSWNPVKVNSHGTLEQRGMDINHPRVIIAVATLVEYIAREVQEKFVNIRPSEKGIDAPFTKEGNTILIPPHEYVRFVLQPKAAYLGLDDDDVWKYCKGLLELGKSCMPKRSLPLLEVLDDMVKKRMTVSDEILLRAKKRGIKNSITNKQAADLALSLSKDLFKEIIMTKQMIRRLNHRK